MKILIVGPVPQAILDRLRNSKHQVDQTCDYFLVPIKLERDRELDPVVIIDTGQLETEALVEKIRGRYAGKKIIVVTNGGCKADLSAQMLRHCLIICTMDRLEVRICELTPKEPAKSIRYSSRAVHACG